MEIQLTFTSQSRLDFSIEDLVAMGIRRAYVTPFEKNNECLVEPEIVLKRLELLREKAEKAIKKGLEVYPFFVTINHPEGNFQIPERYRLQRNLDGSIRPEFICLLDKTRQSEMLMFVKKSAELGFERLAFDDDLRDAFCYCDVHLNGFKLFRGKSRSEIAQILNSVLTHPEYEEIRRKWYEYKRVGLENYARRIEKTVHKVNPKCRIGICTSAKRCQDFSGRRMWEWAKIFHTEEAPVFVRLFGECYDDSLMNLSRSTGWHQYTDSIYPPEIERKLEITFVNAFGYRSPGTVLFETASVLATTKTKTVHWAWTEDYPDIQLNSEIIQQTKTLNKVLKSTPGKPTSFLTLYIGEGLGAYTPTDITIPYGAMADPIIAYNVISLIGIPIVPKAEIQENQPCVISSSYISREMIENIDRYVEEGGVAMLDAIAAQSYVTYGGKIKFNISGASSLHKYEIDLNNERLDFVSDCLPDSVYTINCDKKYSLCESFDIKNNPKGTTVAKFNVNKNGALVVMGYDISKIHKRLLRLQWRKRLLQIFQSTNINVPVYWDGIPAVQVVTYENNPKTITLINYNTQQVKGVIKVRNRELAVLLKPLSVKLIQL